VNTGFFYMVNDKFQGYRTKLSCNDSTVKC